MDLLLTPSGSRLYGTHHAESDYDWFACFAGKGKTTHTLLPDGTDTLRMSLDSFLTSAAHGSPQALEAMWSRECTTDLLGPLRWNFHPNLAETVGTYKRTMKAFWLSGAPKKRMHAHRLSHNLDEFLRTGQFNPTLSPSTVTDLRSKTAANETPYHLQ